MVVLNDVLVVVVKVGVALDVDVVVLWEDDFVVVVLTEVLEVGVVEDDHVVVFVVWVEGFVVVVVEDSFVVTVVPEAEVFWLFGCTLAAGVVVVVSLISLFQLRFRLLRVTTALIVTVVAGIGCLEEQ